MTITARLDIIYFMKIFQGTRIPFGVTVDSTMRCMQCGTYITREQEDCIVRFLETDERECFNCGTELYHDTVTVDILPSSERFLDSNRALNSIWYHATERENWMDALLADDRYGTYPRVHVGTKEAATAIIADQYVRRDGWIYLYTVKLASTAVIAKTIYEDENMWPSRTDDIDGPVNTYRYVNRYEATGSISLLVDPRVLIVEGVKILTPIQAEEMVRQLAVAGRAMA